MKTKVSHLMSPVLVTVNMDDTVEQVEHVLFANKLSAVPVIDSGHDKARNECLGIVSPVELALFHELKRNPKTVRAWEICSYKPVEVGPDTTVREAAQIMVEQRVHHLVITENNSIKGFVKALDLLRELLSAGVL